MVKTGSGGDRSVTATAYVVISSTVRGGRMTEQTMDVGEIRPVVTEWSLGEPRLETRVSPPGLGWDVFGTPADTPAPPVATVATVAVGITELLVPGEPGILTDLGQRVAAVTRRRPADVWVTLECVAVAIAGLSVMKLLDTFALASWVALAGALLVAARTRSQLRGTADLAVMPVLRSLALVFTASSALSVLGDASRAAEVAAAWILILSAVVLMGALLARRSARRPPRVVVIGDRAAISRAAMRWSDGSVLVVGGVLAESETNRMLEAVVDVPTIVGLDQAADWAIGRRADLVIVAPGHGLNTSQVRNLGWSLER